MACLWFLPALSFKNMLPHLGQMMGVISSFPMGEKFKEPAK